MPITPLERGRPHAASAESPAVPSKQASPTSRQRFEKLGDLPCAPPPFRSFAAPAPSPVDATLAHVKSGQLPLRLVFCNHYGTQADNTFRTNADRMARCLSAVCPGNHDGLDLGATTVSDRNIAAQVRLLAQQTGQKVAEIHVFGHVGHGIQRSRAWAQAIKPYVQANVKIVLHGCYQANNADHVRATILAELPQAAIYGHWTGSESGMPYQFARIDQHGVTRLDDPTPEVLPDAYRDQWLEAQATNGPQKLRSLLKSPGIDMELRTEIEHRLDNTKRP